METAPRPAQTDEKNPVSRKGLAIPFGFTGVCCLPHTEEVSSYSSRENKSKDITFVAGELCCTVVFFVAESTILT